MKTKARKQQMHQSRSQRKRDKRREVRRAYKPHTKSAVLRLPNARAASHTPAQRGLPKLVQGAIERMRERARRLLETRPDDERKAA